MMNMFLRTQAKHTHPFKFEMKKEERKLIQNRGRHRKKETS